MTPGRSPKDRYHRGVIPKGPGNPRTPLCATARANAQFDAQFGCGTMRMYGFGDFHSPNSSLAWSLFTDPAMITSSPCFQFTGVAG